MTTIAATNKLDDELRRVWREYYDEVQELTGSEYEQAELKAWELLQEELRELEERRQLLAASAAS